MLQYQAPGQVWKSLGHMPLRVSILLSRIRPCPPPQQDASPRISPCDTHGYWYNTTPGNSTIQHYCRSRLSRDNPLPVTNYSKGQGGNGLVAFDPACHHSYFVWRGLTFCVTVQPRGRRKGHLPRLASEPPFARTEP